MKDVIVNTVIVLLLIVAATISAGLVADRIEQRKAEQLRACE